MNFGRPATFGGATTGGFGAAGGGFAPAAQNNAFGGAQNTAFGSPAQANNAFGGNAFGAAKPAFGAPQQTTAGFGGGAFGAAAAAPAQTNQFGAFGQQQPQNNAFGANKTFGSPGGFGATGQQQATPFGAAAGAFGQPQQPQQGAFGQGAFGQQQQTAATPFGQPFGANKAASTPATGFGSLAKPGAFGQAQATPAFGQTAPLFGQTATQPTTQFGQQTTTTPFGQQPTSTPFGQQPTATPFGQQPSTTPFGQQPAATPFGAPATGAFGATGGFGQAASNPFNQTATTGAFGGATATTAPAFGQPQQSAFGQPQQQQQTGFNIAPTLGGGFGQTTGLGGFGAMGQNQQAGGTGNPPFRPITITESTKNGQSSLTLQAISGMNEYKHKSFEELHWEDFQKGNKGGAPAAGNPMGQMGAFGSAISPQKSFATNTAFGAPAFGAPAQQPAATNTFGAPALGGFGSPTAPAAFGQQPAATTPGFGTAGAFGSTTAGAFGQTTAPGGFGSLTKPGGFGSPSTTTSAFGQPAAGAAPAFGQPLGTGSTSFGQMGSTNTAFGAPAAAGLGGFGQSANTFGKPAGGLGGFGQPAGTAGTFGSPLGGGTLGGFGQPAAAPAGTGGFGQPGAGGFGQPAATGGFGQIAAGGFGQPSTSFGSFGGAMTGVGGGMLGGTTGGFGMPQTQQMNSFLTNPQMQQQMQQQQMQLPPPPVTPSVEHKIDLLLKKSHDMASNTGNAVSKEDQAKADQAQQSLSSPSIILAGLDIGRSKHFSRNTPLSSAKLLSRGIRSNNNANGGSESTADSLHPPSVSSSAINTDMSFNSSTQNGGSSSNGYGSSSSGLFSPTPHVGSAKKLVLSSYGTPSSHSVNRSLPPPAWRTPAKVNTLTPAKTPMNDDNGNGVSGGRSDNDSMLVTPSTNLKVRIMEGLSSVSKVQPSHDSIVVNMSNKINHAAAASEIHWPTLRRDGYETSPSLSVLRTMTEEQLRRVAQFTVIRKNFGKIEWLVPVDIRGEDLDAAVVIEASAVAVYESDTPESTENDRDNVPKRGERLNNPARITLENVWPKGKDLSQEKLKTHEKKLRDFCAANEAKFLSYDGQRGVWVFEVEHFSRYAFVDDDDDEEESQSNDQQKQSNNVDDDKKGVDMDSDDQVNEMPVEELLSSPQVKTSFEKLRSALFTDYSHNNVVSESQELTVVEKNDTSATAGHLMVAVSAKGRHRHANRYLKSPLLDAHDTAASAKIPTEIPDFSAHFHRPTPAPTMTFEQDQRYSAKYRQDFQRIANENRVFFLPEQSPTIRHLVETKQRLLGISSNTPGCTTKSLELQLQSSQMTKKIEKKDLLLFMGRSSRAGFALDGRIAHAASIISLRPEKRNADREELTRCHRLVVERLQVRDTVSRSPLMSMHGETQLLHEDTAASVLQQCVAAIHSVSTHVSRGAAEHFCPLWVAPQAITSDLPQYNRFATCLDRLSRVFADRTSNVDDANDGLRVNHPDWLLFTAIEAVRGAVGQERVLATLQTDCDYMPLSDNDYIAHPELSERRRLFMQQWLVSATREISKQQCCVAPHVSSEDDVFDRAFHYLVSGRDVHSAVAELQSQGQFRLASLVSQVGGDADTRVLLRQQLQLWRDMDVLRQFPTGLRKLYTLLAAPIPAHLFADEHHQHQLQHQHQHQHQHQQKQQDTCTEEDDFEVELLTEMFAGLHWVQCVAVLSWYFPTHHHFTRVATHMQTAAEEEESENFLETGSFAESLAVYRQMLKRHLLAAPLRPPPQMSHLQVPAQTDGVFSLLCAMFLGDDVSSALDMYGMATHDLDFHTNYVMITLLEALQLVSCESVLSVSVRQQVVSQLLSHATPLVFEALFVLSQIPETAGDTQGGASAGVGAVAFLREVLQRCAPHVSPALQQQLCLPTPLVAEAAAYFSAYCSVVRCVPRHTTAVDVLQALMEAGQMAQVAQMLCLERSDLFDTVHDTAATQKQHAASVSQALQIADWILSEDAKYSGVATHQQQQQQQQQEQQKRNGSVLLSLGSDRSWIDVVRLLRDYFAVRDAAEHLLEHLLVDCGADATPVSHVLSATREVAHETQRVLERIVRFYEVSPERVAYVSRFHPQFHLLWSHMATFCYELLAKLHLHMQQSNDEDNDTRDYSAMNVSSAAVLFQRVSQLCFAPQTQTGKGLVDRRVCKATVEYAIRGFTFNAASTLVL